MERMKEAMWAAEAVLAAKQIRLALQKEKPALHKFPAVGTPYRVELGLEKGKERWILSFTARKDGLFHTHYLCRKEKKKMEEFLDGVTLEQWGRQVCTLLREADNIYFP